MCAYMWPTCTFPCMYVRTHLCMCMTCRYRNTHTHTHTRTHTHSAPSLAQLAADVAEVQGRLEAAQTELDHLVHTVRELWLCLSRAFFFFLWIPVLGGCCVE